MKSRSDQAVGYLLILVASCFWGGSASLGKTLMQSGLSTVMLMQIRSVLTLLIIGLVVIIVDRDSLFIKKKDFPAFALYAIPGLALVNLSYYHAVKILPVAIAVFVQFTAPALVFLYGLFRGFEKLTFSKGGALVLSIVGTSLMVQIRQSHLSGLPVAGLISAFISMISFAFYVIVSHGLRKKYSALTLVLYGYGLASILWLIIQNPFETTTVLNENHLWLRAISFAVASTVIPFLIFLIGMRRVSATGASIASTMETVTASLFAFFFLGEVLSTVQIVGAAFIFSAVLLLFSSQEPLTP